jgi:hypothetical protein
MLTKENTNTHPVPQPILPMITGDDYPEATSPLRANNYGGSNGWARYNPNPFQIAKGPYSLPGVAPNPFALPRAYPYGQGQDGLIRFRSINGMSEGRSNVMLEEDATSWQRSKSSLDKKAAAKSGENGEIVNSRVVSSASVEMGRVRVK